MSKETDRSNIIFGTVLICLGLLFLLNTFNLISWRTWNLIVRFWPLILIVIGLNIILKRSKIWWVVPIIIVGLFLGLLFASPADINHFEHFFNDKEYSGSYSYSRDIKQDLEQLQVDINYKAGELILKNTDNNDKLCNTNLMYYDIKPVINYDYRAAANKGHLLIEQKEKVNLNKISENNLWQIQLTDKVPLFINLNAGAGKIDLDISKLKVARLNINSGVSDLSIDYNNYSTETVINAGASNIKIYIPSRVAVKITSSSVINNNNFEEAGLIKLSNKLYQSKNIGEAKNRINIDISTSASNIELVYR